ncbi:MAG: hypothetical protein WCJ64_27015 [Rhodospirillaceae bacterium]
MRFFTALLGAAVIATALPAWAGDLADVTEPSCAETAMHLKQDPENWDSVHYVVQWSYGYIVGSEGLATGTNYKAIGKFMKDLSEGKCSEAKSTLYNAVRKVAQKKVADKDAYDITAIACEDFFTSNTDEYGRLNVEGLIGDLAWLSGYAAGQAKQPPKADFTLLGASGQLTITKCKTSPKLNVSTVLEMMLPNAVAALEKAAAKKAPEPAAPARPRPSAPDPQEGGDGGPGR